MRFVFALALALSVWGQTPPAPGKLVDLGAHRLHVWCTGQGGPTVVVETGLGDFSFDWILVQRKVESFTRICTYDRAGYAWSDPGPKPRTFGQLNLELHDALAKLGERRPFVLVGHSFGGGVVRQYCLTYRAEVAGMVLVDIVHEEQRIPMGPRVARIRDFASRRKIPAAREKMVASDVAVRGGAQAARPLESIYKVLPLEQQRLHAWAASLPGLEDAEDSQKDWSAEYMAAFHETKQDGILGDLPLVVLTRKHGGYGGDLAVELEAERKTTQARLAKLSTRGVQVIVPSGHNMHLENPDAVVNAIRRVVGR